uniref:Peptidase S1 domain-containing protein n=1 Tax=Timema tahoe TaxID=61484 RepID=A0A7R9IPV3_9NEOP|nr:unnamed protein product [Timema tahoe]
MIFKLLNRVLIRRAGSSSFRGEIDWEALDQGEPNRSEESDRSADNSNIFKGSSWLDNQRRTSGWDRLQIFDKEHQPSSGTSAPGYALRSLGFDSRLVPWVFILERGITSTVTRMRSSVYSGLLGMAAVMVVFLTPSSDGYGAIPSKGGKKHLTSTTPSPSYAPDTQQVLLPAQGHFPDNNVLPEAQGPSSSSSYWWQTPNNPFSGATANTQPQPQPQQPAPQPTYEQKPLQPSGNPFLVELTTTCSGSDHVCAPKHLCQNGLVVSGGEGSIQKAAECDVATQICCKLPQQPGIPYAPSQQTPNIIYGPSPSQQPGLIHGGQQPQYVAGGSTSQQYYNPAPGKNGVPIGGSIYDGSATRAPDFKYTGPLNTTPHPGCAAALKCVPESYCTVDGIMADQPISLTREQYENRVPLSECADPDTGVVGKCCRDPNYKDPWPGGMMMPNMGGGQQQLFPDTCGPSATCVQSYLCGKQNQIQPLVNCKVPLDGASGVCCGAVQPVSNGQNLGVFVSPTSPTNYVTQFPQKPGQATQNIVPSPTPKPFQQSQINVQTIPQGPFPQLPNYQNQGRIPVISQQPQPQQTIYQVSPSQPSTQFQIKPQPPKPQYQPQPPTFIPQVTSPQPNYPVPQPQQPTIVPISPSVEIQPPKPQYQPQPPAYEQPQPLPQFPQTTPQTQYRPQPTPILVIPQQPNYEQNQPQPSREFVTSQKPKGGYPAPAPSSEPQQPSPGQACGVRRENDTWLPCPRLQFETNSPKLTHSQTDFLPGYLHLCAPAPSFHIPVTEVQKQGQSYLDAGFGEFPWQAMVLNNKNLSALCSGAIISTNAVITPAHCVQDPLKCFRKKTTHGPQRNLKSGVFYQSTHFHVPSKQELMTPLTWHTVVYRNLVSKDLLVKGGVWKLFSKDQPREIQMLPVAAIVRHPKFDSVSLFHDVAVLMLSTPFIPDQHIDTICLPTRNTLTYNSCVATGWDKQAVQGNVLGSSLHQVPVSLTPHDQCQDQLRSTYLGRYFQLHDSFKCASTISSGAEICQVGPGSPLACENGNGRYELVGLYSWDVGCGVASTPQPAVFSQTDVNWCQGVLATPIEQLARQEQEELLKKQQEEQQALEGVDTDKKPGFDLGYGRK